MITMTCFWLAIALIVLALVVTSYNGPHWLIGAIWCAIAGCVIGFFYGVSEWMWRNMI